VNSSAVPAISLHRLAISFRSSFLIAGPMPRFVEAATLGECGGLSSRKRMGSVFATSELLGAKKQRRN
jgi:hypothetical protein